MAILEEVDLIIMECRLNHKDNFIPLNEVIEYRIRKLLKGE